MPSWSKAFPAVAIFALAVLPIGCNRQDAECISRIGRKASAHAKSSIGDVNAKLDLSWTGVRREPSLQAKVEDRLRFENCLTDVTIEVHVKEKQVELKGTVKTPSQRQRAIELTDTVAGVERVIDSLKLREEPEAK
jgi:osmotically-inducible protein OsmY